MIFATKCIATYVPIRESGRTDDGRKVITIAHPEQSSGELTKAIKGHDKASLQSLFGGGIIT